MLPLKPPKLKKKIKNINIKPVNYPIFDKNGEMYDENSWPIYNGTFKEKVVIIEDSNDILHLSNLGSFGQLGMFDKNTFVDYKTLQNQMLKQKKNWQAMTLVPFDFPNNIEHKTAVNDQSLGESSTSNSTTDKYYIQKIKSFKHQNDIIDENVCIYPQESNNKDNIVEDGPVNWKDLKNNYTKELDNLLILSGFKLNLPYYLLLEEAFFLCYTLECLKIQDESGSVMDVLECWKQFNSFKNNFPHFYAAYHYYRSKGWVVKPGHQYSGDYVLYKLSPIYFHSSFVVIINVNGQNNQILSSWPSWFGCFRAIEATNKDLIICTVHGPEYEEGIPIDLTKYTVNDTIVRRWIPSQNREKFNNQ